MIGRFGMSKATNKTAKTNNKRAQKTYKEGVIPPEKPNPDGQDSLKIAIIGDVWDSSFILTTEQKNDNKNDSDKSELSKYPISYIIYYTSGVERVKFMLEAIENGRKKDDSIEFKIKDTITFPQDADKRVRRYANLQKYERFCDKIHG